MHNGSTIICSDSSGRKILGHVAHSSVGKYTVDDRALDVVDQTG